MKKVLAVVLSVFIILLTVTGCNSTPLNTDDTSDKWVITNETEKSPDGQIISEINYKYDNSGKLIFEDADKIEAPYSCCDFVYDSNGNVVSKTKKYDVSESVCTYTYDENENCVLEEEKQSDFYFHTTYGYDEYGNVIRKDYTREGNSAAYRSVSTYDLTYEDKKLVQSEIEIEIFVGGSYDSTTYNLIKYEYDDNENLATEIFYQENTDINDIVNSLQVNGKYYSEYSTTTYTWSKLSDVATEIITSNKDETTLTMPTETTIAIETTTEQQILDNYGFSNIDMNGDVLVSIKGYNFAEGYVVLDTDRGHSWTFTNGNYVQYEFTDGEYLTYNEIQKLPTDIGTRTIISNDIVQLNIPGDYTAPWSITDRIVSHKFNTVIIKARFGDSEINENWFILENSIDKDRPLEKITQAEIDETPLFDKKYPSSGNKYKLYLKKF